MPAERPQFYIPGGLDTSVQDNQISSESSPDISNFILEDGRMKTAPGLNLISTARLLTHEAGMGAFVFRELDGTIHRLVATQSHIYEDNFDGTWTNRSGFGIWSRPGWYPGRDDAVWFHRATDGDKFLCIAGKAQAPLYSWPGYGNFTQVRTTYNGNGVAELRPIASSMFWNRLCMLSPSIVEGVWAEYKQRFIWSNINDINDFDSGNAGWKDLMDTGGVNVGMLQLGCNMIIYQDNSIWNINHVGGTTIFNPTCAITDYGLLGSRLVQAVGQVHYFVNSYDMNVYQYQGGSIEPRPVGTSIWPSIRDDLDTARAYPERSFMLYEDNRKRLWIFISSASGDVVKAYFLDLRTGQWSTRDYSDKFTTGTDGLTGGYYDKYTDRAMILTNAQANVWDQKTTNMGDEGITVSAYRKGAVLDHGSPDIWKKLDTMAIEAKANAAGVTATVSVSVDGGAFDTISTVTLTTSWKKYLINCQDKGGYRIQTKVSCDKNAIIEVRKIREPSITQVRE